MLIFSVSICQVYNPLSGFVKRRAIMAFKLAKATDKVKEPAGNLISYGGEADTLAHAQAIADKKAALSIGKKLYSVSSLRNDAPTFSTKAETGTYSDCVLVMETATGHSEQVPIQNISVDDYVIADSDGVIDVSNADIQAVATAYSANGDGNTWTVVRGFIVK